MDINSIEIKDVFELYELYTINKRAELFLHCNADANDGDDVDYFTVYKIEDLIVTIIENALRFYNMPAPESQYDNRKEMEICYHTNETMYIRGLSDMLGCFYMYDITRLDEAKQVLKAFFSRGIGISAFHEDAEELYETYNLSGDITSEKIIKEYSWIVFHELINEISFDISRAILNIEKYTKDVEKYKNQPKETQHRESNLKFCISNLEGNIKRLEEHKVKLATLTNKVEALNIRFVIATNGVELI